MMPVTPITCAEADALSDAAVSAASAIDSADLDAEFDLLMTAIRNAATVDADGEYGITYRIQTPYAQAALVARLATFDSAYVVTPMPTFGGTGVIRISWRIDP